MSFMKGLDEAVLASKVDRFLNSNGKLQFARDLMFDDAVAEKFFRIQGLWPISFEEARHLPMHQRPTCPVHTDTRMSVDKKADTKVGWRWRCIKKNAGLKCSQTKSPTQGSLV